LRTFFLQLFLSFWIGTIGIFIGATVFFPGRDPGSAESSRATMSDSARRLATYAVEGMREHGCAGMSPLETGWTVVGPEGQARCGGQLSGEEQEIVASVRERGDVASLDGGGRYVRVQAVTLQSEGGKAERWVMVQRVAYPKRPWYPHLPLSALPVSILVTFLFAFLLTRPVRALSLAFRRFSDGDLSVRLPVSHNRWSGIGGADVRSLMVDFNHMADRVNELIDAQKLLVRDISHELRSPLARLRLALEMTREESPVELASLDRMESEAERVNDLIGQMLTLSLMESRRRLSQDEEFTAEEVLQDLMPDMEFEAAARSCQVVFDGLDGASKITGSRELIRRAFENVIRNAIRFTAPGTQVEVSVSPLEPTAKEVHVQVKDRGPGVPEASLPLLFRAFYRTDLARRDSTGGFGVGLSIAERSVTLHKGRISAVNRVGGGLILHFYLPCQHEI
jgi:two-component system sensor histidine kinase CpxA